MRSITTSAVGSGSGWILRPVVVSVLVYGTLLRIASIYCMGTLRFPTIEEQPAYETGWSRLGTGLTALNLAFAVFLVRELHLARSRPPGLRLAHMAGAALGLVYLAGVQWLILRAPEVYEVFRL